MARAAGVLIIAALLLCSGGVAAMAGGDEHVLDAVVGTNDSFEIALNDSNGKLVHELLPGTYTVVVHDRSRLHNFHLASNTDPTVDFRTELEFVGDQSFTVTFRDGFVYAYACEPHWQTMNGKFVVSRFAGETTTTTPKPKPKPKPVQLTASVSPAGAATLQPRTVRHGAARITVRDRSGSRTFHLVGPGVNRQTGTAFIGSATWNVRVVRGVYRFGADTKKLGGVLRVT